MVMVAGLVCSIKPFKFTSGHLAHILELFSVKKREK
jgi:hypothetical protein